MIQLPEGITRQDLEAMIDLLNSWGEKRQTEGMIDAISHFLNVSGWKQRAEAAEEKLAELDKQDPYAYAYRFKGKQGLSFRKLDIDKCDSRIMPLFTRPVPAINLAEMVPDEIPTSHIYHGGNGAFNAGKEAGWNACRAAILSNIEEKSK